MVRRSLSGAALALVGGTALATALGVMHHMQGPSVRAGKASDPSQKVAFEPRYHPIKRPNLGLAARAGEGGIAITTLPEFMTRDTTAAAGGPQISHGGMVAMSTTADETAGEATAQLKQVVSKISAPPVLAGSLSGHGGGYASAYTRGRPVQGGLAVDLAVGATGQPKSYRGADVTVAAAGRGGGSEQPLIRGGVAPANDSQDPLSSSAGTTLADAGTSAAGVANSANGAGSTRPSGELVDDLTPRSDTDTQSVAARSSGTLLAGGTPIGGGNVGSIDDQPANYANAPAPASGVLLGASGLTLLRRRRA